MSVKIWITAGLALFSFTMKFLEMVYNLTLGYATKDTYLYIISASLLIDVVILVFIFLNDDISTIYILRIDIHSRRDKGIIIFLADGLYFFRTLYISSCLKDIEKPKDVKNWFLLLLCQLFDINTLGKTFAKTGAIHYKYTKYTQTKVLE